MASMNISTPYNLSNQDIAVLNPDDKDYHDKAYYIGIGHYRSIELVVYANCLQDAIDSVIDSIEDAEPNNQGYFLSDDDIGEMSEDELSEHIYGGNHCRYLSFGSDELMVRIINTDKTC